MKHAKSVVIGAMALLPLFAWVTVLMISTSARAVRAWDQPGPEPAAAPVPESESIEITMPEVLITARPTASRIPGPARIGRTSVRRVQHTLVQGGRPEAPSVLTWQTF
jgi:hypothetical protein